MASTGSMISEAELEVLKALWEHGPATLRQITKTMDTLGRTWAKSTVQTLLRRLSKKGFVSREKGEYANVYYASLSRDEVLIQNLDDLSERLCDGMASPLVRALVRSDRFSSEEVEELRQLVRTLDRKQPKKKGKGSKRRRGQ